MAIDPKQLKPLPQKNVADARRIVGNLERRLREIRREAEAVQAAAIKKTLQHGDR